jgi:hypothetical protein
MRTNECDQEEMIEEREFVRKALCDYEYQFQLRCFCDDSRHQHPREIMREIKKIASPQPALSLWCLEAEDNQQALNVPFQFATKEEGSS